jgi:phage gp36-like protein
MPFLTITDYQKQIKSDVLDAVLGTDDNIRLMAEVAAQSEMDSYLNQRFDTTNVFNKTDSNRSAVIVLYLIDMVLYHLHSRINPNNIPALRDNRYKQALAWLKDVAAGKITPNLPRISDTEGQEETGSRFGTEDKLSGQY